MFSEELTALAETVIEDYRRAGLRVATAESCTGGLVAGCLTAVAGSSDVLERGFVSYSNEAKSELLDVSAKTIQRVGAVSAEVAEAMALGALARSRADVTVSVTGIAGPGGGSAGKPVGLVHFGIARRNRAAASERRVFSGDRDAVRQASVARALELLRDAIRGAD